MLLMTTMMMRVLFLVALSLVIPLSNGFVVVEHHKPTAAVVGWTRRFVLGGVNYENDDDDDMQSYHKGGNQRFTKPVVEPSLLNYDQDEDECEDVFVDLATGDELCWNEAPTHAKNVVAASAGRVYQQNSVQLDVADDYHKGGNARFKPTETPTKLMEYEDCETPFIDFATGDELCWNDYRSTP